MLTMHLPAFVSLTLLPAVLAKVQFLGVAIAGGEFGCQIDGTCLPESARLPLSDGPSQMSHFVRDDGMNVLRIPTSWQFLVNHQLGGDLDTSNLARYDQLMQSCLDTGAHCMIDIHNFARWDGGIIGQGGPTDEQFAGFWGQLAGKYAANDKIIFELMNEPHDLDVGAWAQTCQRAVAAIREAGATSQMILLPGTDFDSAATLVSGGGADALLAITNPDGGTDRLLLDIHKYLDADNSGTHAPCTTDNVDALTTVAQHLRSKGRKAFISETGASNDTSCMTAFCAQNSFINANADVFTGLVAWGAGSFGASYLLSLTPSSQDGRLVDSALARQCLLAPWGSGAHGSNGTTLLPTLKPTATASSTVLAPTSLVSTPTTTAAAAALLTASLGMPTFTAPKNGSSSSSSGGGGGGTTLSRSTIDTSDVLILTDVSPENTIGMTLAIATGTPPPRSGFGGLLLTAESEAPSVPTQTRPLSPASQLPTSSTPASGAGSAIVVEALTLWGCCIVMAAAVSLLP